MPEPDITDEVTRTSRLRNHLLKQSSPRLNWNLLKSRAQKAGVDVAKFGKSLGPELDRLVALLEAAKAQQRAGGRLDANSKKVLRRQYEVVEDIAHVYLEIIRTERNRPGATSAQLGALGSLKSHLEAIITNYRRVTSQRAA